MCVLFSLKAIWFIFDFQKPNYLWEYQASLTVPFEPTHSFGVSDQGSPRPYWEGSLRPTLIKSFQPGQLRGDLHCENLWGT